MEPIATPAAVEAICPSIPGCRGCVGFPTLAGGGLAGTAALGAGLLNKGDERPLDLLPPRGIVEIYKRL